MFLACCLFGLKVKITLRIRKSGTWVKPGCTITEHLGADIYVVQPHPTYQAVISTKSRVFGYDHFVVNEVGEMLSCNVSEGLISFRRIHSNQPDPNWAIHVEDGDFIAIVNLNDFAGKRICTSIPARKRANRQSEQS